MKNSKMKLRGMRFFSMAALCAMPLYFTSCSSNSDDPVNSEDTLTEIRLTSTIVTNDASLWGSTRADITQNSNFAKGEEVKVIINKHSDSSSITDQTYTADGKGNLTADTKVYFPYGSDSSVDIYAIHGNFTTSNGSYVVATSTDQSSEANYLKSDFIYGETLEQARTNNAVTVTCAHILSRIEINVKTNSDTTNEVVTGIALKDVTTKATYTPAKTGTSASLTLSASANDKGNISLGTQTQAVIIPQSLTTNKLVITTKGSNESTSTFAVALGKEFVAGNSYTYNVTLTSTGLVVTTEITPWVTAGETSVDAEYQN